MLFINKEIWFPPVSTATNDGLLAVGGDLSVERLLLAYKSGIFPWYNPTEPILWWSPDPRMVLFPDNFKVSKSFRKALRDTSVKVTVNKDFEQVIHQCAKIPRKGQTGTWITLEMIEAYIELHKLGHAKSVEVWENDSLVGGLYGIDLQDVKVFCGESMFSIKANASKIAFYYLTSYLKEKSYKIIDCQIYTDHLQSLGGEEIPRVEFLKYLQPLGKG